MEKNNLDELLCEAAKNGRLASVERLLAQGANARFSDKHGLTPLMWAAFGGEAECARILLPASDTAARAGRRGDGRTALMLACASGSPDCVRILLPHCDPLARDQAGHDALMFAARCGHMSCVDAVLPHSDALATSANGQSAVDLATLTELPAIAARIEAKAIAQRERRELSESKTPAESMNVEKREKGKSRI